MFGINLNRKKANFLKRLSLFFIFLFHLHSVCFSQSGTKEKNSFHSPPKAALMSAIIPGLGQIYNNKVWKVPLLYGGLGVTFYYYSYYQKRYVVARNISKELSDPEISASQKNEMVFSIYGIKVHGDRIADVKKQYERYRSYNFLFIGGIYILNIVDALVDAYMFEYDISDDLSLEVNPIAFHPVFQPVLLKCSFV
ncbi:MAG: hypothetical protein HC906_03975 [Bacteroidales bacterium]|nr:hypothetical protein [Bacteroidales bacterium]